MLIRDEGRKFWSLTQSQSHLYWHTMGANNWRKVEVIAKWWMTQVESTRCRSARRTHFLLILVGCSRWWSVEPSYQSWSWIDFSVWSRDRVTSSECFLPVVTRPLLTSSFYVVGFDLALSNYLDKDLTLGHLSQAQTLRRLNPQVFLQVHCFIPSIHSGNNLKVVSG